MGAAEEITMEFPALDTSQGLELLERHLSSRSYLSDYQPTTNDLIVFKAIAKEPKEYFNVARWYRHIQSFDKKDFPSAKGQSVTVSGTSDKAEVLACCTHRHNQAFSLICLSKNRPLLVLCI